MTGDLPAVLSDIDPDKLRASTADMRTGLRTVAAATAGWTRDWEEMLLGLRDVARLDLCLARLIEGHADALRILDEAGASPQDGLYGVWASRSVGTGLRASRCAAGWQLTGKLRYASGIDLIDRALVPGWPDEEHHLLFDISAGRLTADRDSWNSPAMDASRSFTVEFESQSAGNPIGPTNFYLERPGFVAGGLGPAAVWAGGVHQIAEVVAAGLRRFTATPHQLRRLGLIDQAAWSCDAALQQGMRALSYPADHEVKATVSGARTAIAIACEAAAAEAPHIVGPGGLSTNRRLARVLGDLAMYVRQHHLDATLEALGGRALADRRTVGP